MKKHKSIEELIREISSGDEHERSRSAGRLMTVSEESPSCTIQVLSALQNAPEPRMVLGITGAPGSGKSVFCDRLISEFRARYPERKIGIIAVDPSSPFSGGALLGDRVRMMKHATDPNVFIRSAATRGQLGGITLGTLGAVRVMGLFGADAVIVETVGVGQMEFSIREVSDLVAVVLAPGQGDTIQFLKAGLMEVGDIFVANKSDRSDAKRFQAQLKEALHLSGGDEKPVFSASAKDNVGISVFVEYLEKSFASEGKSWKRLRENKLKKRIRHAVLDEARSLLEDFFEKNEGYEEKILQGEASLSEVVAKIFFQQEK